MINNVANLHDTHVGVRAYVLICEDTCLIMQLCAWKKGCGLYSAALKTGVSDVVRQFLLSVLFSLSPTGPSAPVSQTKILPITFSTRNVFLQNGFIMTSFLIVAGKGRGNEEWRMMNEELAALSYIYICIVILHSSFFIKYPYSTETQKQGHCLIYSQGSMVPFPFKSGERSRWPQIFAPG